LVIAGRNLKCRVEVADAAAADLEHARTRSEMESFPVRSGPHEREVIIKEVVKVHCRYCGSLNLQSDKKCGSCGGRLA
jgi:hypothetical protein